MNCKNCGSPLNSDSKFCNVCGTKVESNIEGENNVVETSVKPEMSNVVNPIPNKEEVTPAPVVESQKEVVNTPEPTESDQASVIETTNNGAANAQTPIAQNPTPVVESQNVVNNNVSTMQNQFANNQGMVQNNQPVVNNVPNNPMPNNMNYSAQAKKTPVGLIVGIGVGAAVLFIIFLVVVIFLTGGIKFNATIKAGGTTKQIVGNKTTTTSKTTTSKVTNSSTPNGNNNSNKPKDAFDALLKLYTGDNPTEKTYEQVAAIIGEGVKDEKYSLPKYTWEQDENTRLTIVFYSSGNQYIMDVEVDYDKRDALRDPNVNLSGAQAISKNINEQIPVYYNDIKTSFGNEGRLSGFGSYDYKYVWVNETGGYVEARFNKETNQCLSFFGRV